MICSKCVLPDSFPNIEFDNNGVCNYCKQIHKNKIEEYIPSEEYLEKYLMCHRNEKAKYDVLIPVSGGVDSSMALIKCVRDFKLKVLAYHNDHGYEDDVATENVKKICEKLSIDLIILRQDFVFMKKLWKYLGEAKERVISGCYACGNILYLNSIELAEKFGIKLIINGYSKGQANMMNNRETGMLILEKTIDVLRKTGDKEFLCQFMNKYKYLQKKINFEEAISSEDIGNRIVILPFYMFNFYKNDKAEYMKILEKEYGWKKLNYSYPCRTTNCKMVWLNTYVDLKKMNYSMYHEEYAELVRRKEITREQALADLDFNPPEGLIESLAKEIDIEIS